MRFTLTFAVNAFPELHERAEFRAGDVAVTIEALEQDPRDESKKVTLMVATTEIEPPQKATEALRALASGEIPAATPFDDLPGSLKEFSGGVWKLLRDAIVRTFEVVRWRFNIVGPPHPFSSRGAQWSEDGADPWHRLPSQIFIHTGAATIGVPLGAESIAEVDALLEHGAHEPLAHYMLREARASATRHTVSALVMAVAAAEIGVKRVIADAVPDAEWLVENVASPPVVKLLKEYVPSLPGIKERHAKVPVPDSIIETLNKGVTRRNTASHLGEKSISLEFTDRVLEAVNDLLRLLDFYQGADWALNHVDYDRLIEMGLVKQDD